MPRPGPRPYECVRRAWHSDRHQPIRGSLIQEIFRVVNEVHSSATKKNKEWQEKLPVVVLKAEEIMYSKANSAAEYMDLKTLWDRTNDAINTIIRRDESVETGELLQPCIEAALNLGCTPRRASRSQRNTNPRFYLSPNTQEPNSFYPPVMPNAIQANHITNSLYAPYLNCINATVMNPTHLCPEPYELVSQTINVASNEILFATDDVTPSNINQCFTQKKCPALSLQSIYPLYYGSCLESETDFGVVSKSVPGTTEPVTAGHVENLSSFPEDASTKISQIDVKDTTLNPQEIGCDLSLRLGSLPSPLPNAVKTKPQVFKDVDYGSLHEETKLNNQMRQVDKEFSVFTTVNVDDPLASCPMKLGEHVKVDPTVKKRKTVFDHHVDNKQLCWQPKLQCGNLTGRMKSAVSARYLSENSEEVEDCGEEELNDEEQ